MRILSPRLALVGLLLAPAGCADDSGGPVVPRAEMAATPATPSTPAPRRVGRSKIQASGPSGVGGGQTSP